MLDKTLGILAPHHCYGCQKMGTTLCESCQYNITSDAFLGCILCCKVAREGVCDSCGLPYQKAWIASERSDTIQELIDGYKFSHQKSSARVLAALLNQVIPELPHSTVILPIPTVNTHIRQRGYDHISLIAHELASMRGLRMQSLLKRKTNTTQLGATRQKRIQQAKEAFIVEKRLEDVPYLLIDDVFTTGSTIEYASKVLKNAGAKSVWVAVIARQPIDK